MAPVTVHSLSQPQKSYSLLFSSSQRRNSTAAVPQRGGGSSLPSSQRGAVRFADESATVHPLQVTIITLLILRRGPNPTKCRNSARPSFPEATTTIICPKSLRLLPRGKKRFSFLRACVSLCVCFPGGGETFAQCVHSCAPPLPSPP